MFNQALFRFRYAAVLGTTLFVLWMIALMWFYIPFADFNHNWRPDDQMMISEITADSIAYPLLQNGDAVVAIDGQQVFRRANFFTTPRKDHYTYTILRHGQELTVNVPMQRSLTAQGFAYRIPSIALSLTFWVTGIVILHFATRENLTALHVGYIFLVSGLAIIGLQGELLGATGAWLSRLFWMFAHVGTLYLGFIPIAQKPTKVSNRGFTSLLIFALFSGFGALLEAAVLFPQHNSLDRLIGMGFYELSLLLSALSWLIVLAALIYRAFRLGNHYERQQVRILLYFIALGTLPVTLLTLIPRALFDVVFLPFPVAISLFVLVPIGFFFVVYRRGYLNLDIVFSRITIFITHTAGMIIIYGTGLYGLYRVFDFGTDTVLPAVLTLIPVLIVIQLTNQTVEDWISVLFFGKIPTNRTLPQFASALSSKPEIKTLQLIVSSVTSDLNILQAALVLKTENNLLTPLAMIRVDDWPPYAQIETFHKPLLRSADGRHLLFAEYPWLELLIPIIVRHEQIGFLALSRPRDSYFNAPQITFLSRVADMIAVGSEAISLFEASRTLSLQLLSAQEMERKNLATQIHDRPLQMLSFVHHGLRDFAHTGDLEEATHELSRHGDLLQTAIAELRQICAGLYPPVIEQGLELVVLDVTDHFENAFGLEIINDIQLPNQFDTSTEIATAAYRILTESLNNVVKHAQTDQVMVQLYIQDCYLILAIIDDGIGSGMNDLSLTELTRLQHLGVRGMHEWGKLVQGNLVIEANQPTGTKVRLEIPL